MSTIVYQNLVSCKETTTTIKLKFAAAAPASSLENMNTSLDNGNWGLLQTYPKEPVERIGFCTQYQSPFSRLSAKSLELCTESLGSESVSDVITDCSSNVSIFSGSSSFSHSDLIEDTSSYSRIELEKPEREAKSSASPRQAGRNTTKRPNNFPPPLNSMSGTRSLQMRRRCEGGRLIIDVVEAPFRNSYLHAERNDGRLRLCFLTGSDSAVTTTSASSAIEEEQQQSEHECGGDQAEPEEADELQSEIESGKEEFEGEMNYEMGLEKFQMFGRCKEGGHGSKGLCSVWKPAFCVAT
ncbi:protein FANTASTIC FOUR 3-like [Primulina huaijiensis]|uniref:protein FANTASTIC FOUR 3-like n=1 Tax=Primulina huaijiensis TaxID=1492673 RepID=UPI003CC77448